MSNDVINLFEKQINSIPTKEFAEIVVHLDKNRDSYSIKARAIADELKTLVKTGLDAYTKSSDLITKWCTQAAIQLESYLAYVGSKEKRAIITQQEIIVWVLEDGLRKMNGAQAQLEQASRNFNKASGLIIAFTAQLNEDFGPSFNGLTAYKVMSKICIKCAMPLPSTLNIADIGGILTANLAKLRAYNAELEAALKAADKMINDTKTQLLEEIRIIGEVKTKTQVSLDTIKDVIEIGELDDVIQNELKIPIEKLILNCYKYRQQHTHMENDVSPQYREIK